MGSESGEILMGHIKTLLAELEKRAQVDREAGRLPVALILETGIQAVGEYTRRLENSIRACRASLSALEKLYEDRQEKKKTKHALDSQVFQKSSQSQTKRSSVRKGS